MKMKFIPITLLIISLFLITSCTKQQKEIEIYSFSGENDAVIVYNGLIIITDDIEKFIGGELAFKGEEPLDVKHCITKFFFYKDEVETTILSNSESIEGTTKGTRISPDMGSISSEDLFYGNDLESIKNSLNFSLNGNLMNGKNFEHNVVLDVKRAY
ncbi:MAG: hypothetical protein ACOYI2_08995 [Bacillota bacterium]|jgi:hypothetical protein